MTGECSHHEAVEKEIAYVKDTVKKVNDRMFWILIVVIVHLLLSGGGIFVKAVVPSAASALGLG